MTGAYNTPDPADASSHAAVPRRATPPKPAADPARSSSHAARGVGRAAPKRRRRRSRAAQEARGAKRRQAADRRSRGAAPSSRPPARARCGAPRTSRRPARCRRRPSRARRSISPRNDRLLATAIGISVADPRRHPADPLPAVRSSSNAERQGTAARGRAGQREDRREADQGRHPGAGAISTAAATPTPIAARRRRCRCCRRTVPTSRWRSRPRRSRRSSSRRASCMTQLQVGARARRPCRRPPTSREKTDLPTANELMQRTLEAMRLEAQIAKDMEAYQKRPKRRFIGARAEEYRFARYVEDWRLKIERVGNLNYPEAARQQKLYGNLLLTVSIRSDGIARERRDRSARRAAASSTPRRCGSSRCRRRSRRFRPTSSATPTSCTSRAPGRSPRRIRWSRSKPQYCRIRRGRA